MGNKCFCCSRKNDSNNNQKFINILLLGLSDSGKTEIGCKLSNTIRTDYSRTNGVRVFKRYLGDNFSANITEIGGSEQMQKIWRHYFVKAMGLIYTVDVSQPYDKIKLSLAVLKTIMQHKYMIGKPVVFMATKIEKAYHAQEGMNFFELNEILDLDRLANENQTHVHLEQIYLDDFNTIYSSFNWLMIKIRDNYQYLLNRIDFDVNDANTNRFPIGQFKETNLIRSARMALLTFGERRFNRPQSAPAAFRRNERVAPADYNFQVDQAGGSNEIFNQNYVP